MKEPVWVRSDCVTVEKIGSVVSISLSAPSTRNALTSEMKEALFDAVSYAEALAQCKVVIVGGSPTVFSSGGDLRRLSAPAHNSPDREELKRSHELVRHMVMSGKPYIAAIEGGAYGAGLSLALACDFVIASRSAKLAVSFGKFGLMPDLGMVWTLPRRVGVARARAMLLCAETVGAEQALAEGLIDKVCSDGTTWDVAQQLAERLAALSVYALDATKRATTDYPQSLEEVLKREIAIQPELLRSKFFADAVAEFLGDGSRTKK